MTEQRFFLYEHTAEGKFFVHEANLTIKEINMSLFDVAVNSVNTSKLSFRQMDEFPLLVKIDKIANPEILSA